MTIQTASMTSDMAGYIRALPDDLEAAWQRFLFDLPTFPEIRQI